jgi:hypothetical protein
MMAWAVWDKLTVEVALMLAEEEEEVLVFVCEGGEQKAVRSSECLMQASTGSARGNGNELYEAPSADVDDDGKLEEVAEEESFDIKMDNSFS